MMSDFAENTDNDSVEGNVPELISVSDASDDDEPIRQSNVVAGLSTRKEDLPQSFFTFTTNTEWPELTEALPCVESQCYPNR